MSDYVCLAFEFKCLQQFPYASPTTVSGGQKTCLFSTPIFQARRRLIKEPHSHGDLYSGKTWMGLEMVECVLYEAGLMLAAGIICRLTHLMVEAEKTHSC